MANILIVDSESVLDNFLEAQVNKLGYCGETVNSLHQGIAKAESGLYDIIFLDASLVEGHILDQVNKFRSHEPSPDIVVLSANSSPEEAEQAIKAGAWDYVAKPIPSHTAIQNLVTNIIDYRKSKRRSRYDKEAIRTGIIGNSQQLLQCLENLVQVAMGTQNVLITGETGTGKELFATAVHMNSSRAKNQFIVADCTSIPETLAESLLFGHIKGSFTGANSSTLGLFRQAGNGTLFLDEIGDLSLSVQKSLLRVLQEKRVTPVGSSKEIHCDFRLVSATNRSLEELVKKGLFRKDLYYRLITSILYLPPLRERTEDIQPLIDYYLPKCCADLQLSEKGYSQNFLLAMQEYNWPGNVRELINTINTACTTANADNELQAYHLPTDIRVHLAKKKASNSGQHDGEQSSTQNKNYVLIRITPNPDGEYPTYKQSRQEIVHKMEKIYLTNLLDYSQRNIVEACRISGLSRARLYELLKKHAISLKK